ncbi:MAG: glycosyltransferase family 39 protein, partial [Chloroflexota bacterium]
MRTRLSQLKPGFNLWTLFALALFIRWGAFYGYYFVYKTPGGIAPSPTSSEVYELIAVRMLDGEGLSPVWLAYRPPLEPMLIASVYAVTGLRDPLLPVLAQTVLSAATCLFAYAIAKELGMKDAAAKTAVLLMALDPASVASSLVLLAETLSNFFIAWSLVFLARCLQGR